VTLVEKNLSLFSDGVIIGRFIPPARPPRHSVKAIICLLTVLLLFASVARADDIKLADGKTVFHNAKIISQDAASVTIKHSTGVARDDP
jgi:hypothetical protein